MNFLIIGPANSPNSSDLEKEIKKRGYKVDRVSPDDLVFEITKGNFEIYTNEIDLKKYDIFLFRGTTNGRLESSVLAEELFRQNKILVNEATQKRVKENKLYEAIYLSANRINYPKTYYIKQEKSFEIIKKEIIYPVIIKPVNGSEGKDIYKFKEEKSLGAFILKNGNGWMIQECLNIDGDVRVFVVKDKVLGAMKRYLVEGDCRSNFSLGAKIENFQLTKQIEKIALKAAEVMGREIAGVDLACDNNKWYVIEVNSTPGWQGFKKATGINPAEAIVDYSISKFNRSKKYK